MYGGSVKASRGISVVVVLGLAVVGAAAGCSSTGASQTPAPAQSSATDLPANHRWVEVPTQDVSVAVPSTWIGFSSQDTPENLAIAAKGLGITVEELKARLPAETLVQVRAPSPDLSNLNATVVDLDSVPSGAELTSQLEGAGAQDVAVRSVHTAVGEAVLATYRQQVTAGTLYGAGLFIDTGDSLLNLTVTSSDRATVTSRTDVLTTSVHRP